MKSLSPIKLVLADDHAVVRAGLRAYLKEQRHIKVDVIAEAADGRDAVHQAEQLHPDIVLMDISMPELNGIEATEQIRANDPEVNVVMLSMHADPDHFYRARDAGARGYVLKAAAGEEVVEAIRAVAGGGEYFSRKLSPWVVEGYAEWRADCDRHDPLRRLSQREREVLQLVVEGNTNAEIATRLVISQKTVETYRSRLMSKLHLEDIPALVRFAMQHGIIPVPEPAPPGRHWPGSSEVF
jgi:DNA-binding NarL/FixJ family response regulator